MLNFYSPRMYDYVRTTFNTCLPHPRTISKWYQHVDGAPGFRTEAFQVLKDKGPGDVGPSKKATTSSAADTKTKRTDAKAGDGSGDAESCLDEKAIWSEDEVVAVDDMHDPREEPRYSFSYRQDVGAEDVFLQLGPRTPTTASCEWLVVEVWLEGERRADVDVSLQPQQLDLRSPHYRLSLALPQPVLPDCSAATWDPDNYVLKLRLRMSRELDFVNF